MEDKWKYEKVRILLRSQLLFLLLGLYGCGISANKNSCKLPKPKTIFFDFDKTANDYDHYVLLDGYRRECMDSSEMVNMAKKYATNLKEGKPALWIRFYSSDDYFIPDEVSQPMHEINKNCLLLLTFNRDMEPVNFVFYDNKADWIYDGPLWKPNG